MQGRWHFIIGVSALAILAVYGALSSDMSYGIWLPHDLPTLDQAVSWQAFAPLLERYALPSIVMMLSFAGGLFLYRRLSKIHAELNNLQADVNRLNTIEARRFLLTLNSGAAGATRIVEAEGPTSSIIPTIGEGGGTTEPVRSGTSRRSR
jgi:hypothetical protein